MKWEQIGAEQKAKHGSKGSHTVHEAWEQEKSVRKSLKIYEEWATHQCTSRNFPSLHDRRHMLSLMWTADCHRNRVKVVPKRKTKLVQKSTIYSQGNYFLYKRLNKLFLYIVATANRQITSDYYVSPRQDLIIYWYDDRTGRGPCLAHAPTLNGKCYRRSCCRAWSQDLSRRWNVE